jgi:type III pantothenate kinase
VNLCIDIGNSTFTLGLFSGDRLVRKAQLEIRSDAGDDAVFSFLEKCIGAKSVKRVAIVSVVPALTVHVSSAIKKLLTVTPLVIGPEAVPRFKLLYRNREKLGMDRMVNAYGAARLYGGPAVVIDAGTAITWDAVDDKGRFVGGAIAPGPGTMAFALKHRSAMLPEVRVKKPKTYIGHDTEECIRVGIYHGTVGMVRELAAGIAKQLGGKAKVILTGGAAPLFAADIKNARLDEDLTLKAVNIILDERKDFPVEPLL